MRALSVTFPLARGKIIPLWLKKTCFILFGISSGANVLGAIRVQETLGEDAVIVTVFSDSNKKYLSTDLMKTEPVKENYLSPQIGLQDYLPVKRAYGG